MGMLAGGFYSLGGDSIGTVVMNGGSSVHITAGSVLNAGHEFTTTGIIYGIGPGAATRTQYFTGEWWSDEPEVGIGSSYDVRCASIDSGNVWDTQAASVGTWIQMNADRVWLNNVTLMNYPPGDISSNSCTFEISATGVATALDSGTYVATADNQD